MLARVHGVLAGMAPADPRARLLQIAMLRRDEILLEALLRRLDAAPLGTPPAVADQSKALLSSVFASLFPVASLVLSTFLRGCPPRSMLSGYAACAWRRPSQVSLWARHGRGHAP